MSAVNSDDHKRAIDYNRKLLMKSHALIVKDALRNTGSFRVRGKDPHIVQRTHRLKMTAGHASC